MNKLIETTLWESATADAGIITDVKVLGQRSKNRRIYTDEAMQEAVGLYEGKAVYISHAGPAVKHRPAHERFGRLKNVRYEAARKELRGDLVFLESQSQMTAMLKEDMARGLNFFGLSHVADGLWHRDKQGNQVVTKIEKVDSVDLVSDPATASSLREQEDAPAAADAPNPADQALADAFSQAVLAVLQDASLDVPGKVAKIQAILEKHEELKDETGDKKDEKGDAPAADKKEEQTAADPVAKLTEQIDALKAQVAALAKPRKYVTAPTAPAKLAEQTAPTVTETDAPPKDKAALRKWLLK